MIGKSVYSIGQGGLGFDFLGFMEIILDLMSFV
jgi:hypothetical protein